MSEIRPEEPVTAILPLNPDIVNSKIAIPRPLWQLSPVKP
jgi:hypothetical protein